MSMLIRKVGLTLIPKKFWISWCLFIIEITKFWIFINLNYQISLCLIFSNIILKFSSICFVFKFRALHKGSTKILVNIEFMITV